MDGECDETVDFFFYDTTPFVSAYHHKNYKEHVMDWRGLKSDNWTAQLSAQVEELREALNQSRGRFKIVIGHHPVFSYGHHGDTEELVDQISPLLEEYKVDLYMNGHDHDLQHVEKSERYTQFINCGGGSKAWHHGDPRLPDDHYPKDLKYFYNGQGFASLLVTREELRLHFHTLEDDTAYTLRLNGDRSRTDMRRGSHRLLLA
eukprot:SM000085S23263  [mRNA]  locus=s85:339732:341048:- [translate_table: standard]